MRALTPPRFKGPEALKEAAHKLIVIGDTQSRAALEIGLEQNARLRPELIRNITERPSGPDAVLHLGDLVTWGHSKRHWRDFDAEWSRIREAGIPVFPVFGNHDLMPLARPGRDQLYARFPHLQNRSWYTFTYRNLAFIALDSTLAVRRSNALTSAQDRFLLDAIQTFDNTPSVHAIIGLWHHAPFTNSRIVSPSTFARAHFLPPLLDSPKSLAVFSGHCHAYEHFVHDHLHCIVSGGGGGPRQRLRTGSDARFVDLYPGGSMRFLHLIELTVHPHALGVEVLRFDPPHRMTHAERFTLHYARGRRTALVS